MSDKNGASVKVEGLGLFSLTFLVLLTLKLIGVGTFSWWWVIFPLVAPLLFVTLFVFIAVFVMVITEQKKSNYFSPKKIKHPTYTKYPKSRRKWDLVVDDLLKQKRFELLDLDAPADIDFTPKKRFSLKRWWKEGCVGPTLWQRFASWYKNGNEKARQKKLAKSEKTS